MPNWTNNVIRIDASKATTDKVKKLMETEDFCFDFNQLIPMPKSLNMTSGTITDEAIVSYLSDGGKKFPEEGSEEEKLMRKLVPNFFFDGDRAKDIFKRFKDKSSEKMAELTMLGEQYVINVKLYGAPTWYEWRNLHWGTKWNACDPWFEEGKNQLTYYFDTAWAPPFPIFEELSKRFPKTDIKVEFRNEDGYENIYYLTFKNGDVISESMEVDEEYLEECAEAFEE